MFHAPFIALMRDVEGTTIDSELIKGYLDLGFVLCSCSAFHALQNIQHMCPFVDPDQGQILRCIN